MGIFYPSISQSFHLGRVRIICACPSRRPTGLVVAVDDADDRAVGTGNHEECSRDDDEDGPEHHEHPLGRLLLLALAPVVIQPHAAHGLEADQGTEKGTDERNETAENGDGASDDVGDTCTAASASNPGHPVNLCVARKVSCSSEESDEEVLGGELMEYVNF